MKITRLKIRHYRGIEALDEKIPETGAVIRGGNARGKTSTLKAIRAALAGNDIGPDAVRLGADSAEILVDLDDITVRRVIRRGSGTSSLTVKTAAGDTKAKPQAFLTDLLGTSAIDPLELFLAKPKDRRAQILAALPVAVTREQLLAFAPDLPPDFDVAGHGMEVLERARKLYYDRRTSANAEAKATKADAERLAVEADELGRGAPADAPAPAEAQTELDRARARAAALEEQERQARAADERSAKGRERVAELREQATHKRATASRAKPWPEALAALTGAAKVAQREVERLRAELAAAEAEAERTRCELKAADNAIRVAAELEREANDAETSAAEIERAIAEAAAPHATEAELEAAAQAITDAEAALASAKRAEAARVATARADKARALAEQAAGRATLLDSTVRALTNDAPSVVFQDAGAIPGLTLEGDEVLLDGVNIDGLSGAEQMRFAVEIARRANAKSRILVVDGLERLDPEQLEVFVREATRDGYQIIATKVDRGEVVFDAIEPSVEAEAAE